MFILQIFPRSLLAERKCPLTDEYNYTQSEIAGILYGSANEKGAIVSDTQLMGQAFNVETLY